MAAERDESGPQGPGLSGTGRDHSGLEAGTTGSASFGDQPGTAEVHAGIAFGGQAGTSTAGRATSRVKDVAGTVRETASDLGQRARDLAGDVGERAGDLASQARDRLSGVQGRVSETLERRGMLEKVRDNPVPALGVAFAVGFLLAGSSSRDEAQGVMGTSKAGRARNEIRQALMAGLSAGLAQGARSFMRNAGASDGVINSVLENLPGLGGGSTGGSTGGSSGGTQRTGATGGMGGSQYASATGGRPTGGAGKPHRQPSHREAY